MVWELSWKEETKFLREEEEKKLEFVGVLI